MKTAFSPRTESRHVRPFNVPTAYLQMLNGCTLTALGSTVESGKNVRIDPSELRREQLGDLVVHIPADIPKLARNSYDPPTSACSLIIFASSEMLKRTVLLDTKPLSSLVVPSTGLKYQMGDDVFRDVTMGFEVTVAVVLHEELKKRQLLPHMKGTWLSRSDFGFRMIYDDSSFSPVELHDSTREELELPLQTLSYVQFGVGQKATTAESLSELLTLYLDAGVLARIHSRKLATESHEVLLRLAIDLIVAVIVRGAHELAEDGEPASPTSIYARMIDKQQFSPAVTEDKIVEWAKDDPDRLRAIVASNLSLNRSTTDLLTRGD